jgi:hypothetical protein
MKGNKQKPNEDYYLEDEGRNIRTGTVIEARTLNIPSLIILTLESYLLYTRTRIELE